MTNKKLHIVAFNIPYPADYGGVIDVFYKLKALHEQGVGITLHTFEYGRPHPAELEQYCEKVYYYPRRTGWRSQLSYLPYIVYSRRSNELLNNLLQDNEPILFEGLHTCYYLTHPALRNREKGVRIHNIEHVYYRGLAVNSRSLRNKLYFYIEAFRLRKFEKKLQVAGFLFCLSTTEKEYFDRYYGQEKTIFLPLFFQSKDIAEPKPATQPAVLYHGDLSTPENRNAALFVMQQLAPLDTNIAWLIAGKNPHPALFKEATRHPNVTVRANLTEPEMQTLLQEAAVHFLYTNQISGVKLKLLNALHSGGHCIANAAMLAGSGLDSLCRIMPGSPQEILSLIRDCLAHPFTPEELQERREKMRQIYDNQRNAQILINRVY